MPRPAGEQAFRRVARVRCGAPGRPRAAWLGGLLLLAGCGVPVPDSQYVPMDDGTRIAVDVWLPRERPADGRLPAVLRLGRYWRDYALPPLLRSVLGRYPRHVAWLNEAGYAVVMVDVRGTGASFGRATTPWSPREVADYALLADWVVAQPWSDGRLGAYGISYDGVSADWLGALGHPAVRAVLPTYSYCDIFLDISHPGGILNERFVKAWGDLTYLMDRNDPDFLHVLAQADPTGLLAPLADVARLALAGVRPVSGQIGALLEAVAQHLASVHLYEMVRGIEYRDDAFETVTADAISPLLGAPGPQRTVAIRRVAGWLDGGVARGALRSFNTLAAPHHVLILAPHAHAAGSRADPYDFALPPPLDLRTVIREVWEAVPFFDAHLKGGDPPAPRREVIYYTYVANTWQRSPVWPPEGFTRQRWYFAADGGLRPEPPTAEHGEDVYTVDFAATTGRSNRWFSALGGAPILYPDRAAQDRRLLVYQTPPLEADVELTGHPVVSLRVRSTHADGAFYIYLEDVAPDGRVFYLTEGQMRAVHRRIGSDPPAAEFGPYHTFRRADALPLEPGAVAEIALDLLPISTVIRAGHRLRVAIAGHDADTFVRYPAEGTPTLAVQRNAVHASYVDLPLRPR